MKSTAVVLYGLPPEMTADRVQSLLSSFGQVLRVQLSSPTMVLPPTVIGYAEMATTEEAERLAVLLNDFVFYGRSITVYATVPFLNGSGAVGEGA